ncbi:hypothetical protein TRFO_16197 [Tritrichomonas foetus]|uniref:Initiator binding domain-containing protein n=1 Tax=Tritrichomonas foetus TaxID=1144522 RepID=A0A1J4KQU7_9EUKA|nr:hypothetical protein TRFO_16197 [Tritrichomonas foetus]|eukprot:OHT13639.1 hypothetical protein TRFO_16197 [Tritrichomonas foetus]
MNTQFPQKPPLTIADLLAKCTIPPPQAAPPHSMPPAGHRRIFIESNNPIPALEPNASLDGISFNNKFNMSMSSHDFRLLPNPEFSPSHEGNITDGEDADSSNISLFTLNGVRTIGNSLPAFNVRHSFQSSFSSLLPNPIPFSPHNPPTAKNHSLTPTMQSSFQSPKGIENMTFEEICNDPAITINPRQMEFIPETAWNDDEISFGALVNTFFRKRNSTYCKFPFKLYNALKLAEHMPQYIPHVGVQWVNDKVIKVDREPFARLIGVKTVEGGLFHQQGNFPSHGFIELTYVESDRLSRAMNFGPADLSVVRFVTHVLGKFVRDCREEDLDTCRWTNPGPQLTSPPVFPY